MPNLAIRAEYAPLVSLFVSDEDTRYYLKGFYVEPAACGGVYIVATDSHRLGLFHDRLGVCDQPSIWRLDPATLKACVAKKADDCPRWLVIEQVAPGTDCAVGYHNVTVAQGDSPDDAIGLARSKVGSDLKMHIAQAKPIDGPFPDYKRAIPRNMPDLAKTKLQAQAYNGNYIASFAKVAATREGDYYSKYDPILMIASDELGSPSVVLTRRYDFVGIIMPVGGSNVVLSALPDWYPASTKPAAAAAE